MEKIFANKNMIDPSDNFKENRHFDTENIIIHVRKDSIKSTIITLEETKNIPKLKVINPYDNSEIDLGDEIMIYVNNKPYVKTRDMLLMEFQDAEMNYILSNKSMLYIRYKFNDRFYVDQFISTRSIELYFIYKLDNMHISFLVWKTKSNELRKSIKENNTNTFSINTEFKLDLTNIDQDIDNETKDIFISYPYINFKQICECSKFRDLFLTFENIYNLTKDLNYIKSVDYLSKLAYQKMGGN